jgi:hypothetical protein
VSKVSLICIIPFSSLWNGTFAKYFRNRNFWILFVILSVRVSVVY